MEKVPICSERRMRITSYIPPVDKGAVWKKGAEI